MRRLEGWAAELALLVLFAVAGSVAAAATFVRLPPPAPKAPPPLNVSRPSVDVEGTLVVVSFNLTSCRVPPTVVRVEVMALNRSKVISSAPAGSGCGSFEAEMPASPYEVLHPAVYVVNASLPGSSYVVGYFVERANVTYSFEFANISYVNGTPVLTLRYTAPFRANISVRALYVIDGYNDALAAADCSSTSPALAPPAANGTVSLPLSCTYVNPAEFARHVYFDYRGAVVATYFTPGGNFTQEVSVRDVAWH